MMREIPDKIPRGVLFQSAVLTAETDKLCIVWFCVLFAWVSCFVTTYYYFVIYQPCSLLKFLCQIFELIIAIIFVVISAQFLIFGCILELCVVDFGCKFFSFSVWHIFCFVHLCQGGYDKVWPFVRNAQQIENWGPLVAILFLLFYLVFGVFYFFCVPVYTWYLGERW